MKKAQREPFRALTTVHLPREGRDWGGVWALCNMCKYASWHGSSCDADLDCQHPLLYTELMRYGDITEQAWSGDGGDCPGFRPKYDVETAADMVGVMLQGEYMAEPA